ncbi:hypothetical protein D3C81_221450 [compost metagenome]
MIEEQFEQGKVGAGEDHLLSITVEQAVADRVQAPVVEGQHRTARRRLAELGAAQQSLDSRLQFAGAERLAQIVVSAQLQADDPVGLVGAGGEHDDRYARLAWVLAYPAAQAEAVFVGQHDVKNDQVAGRGFQRVAKALAVSLGMHLEAGAAQVGLQQFTDFLVVVDHQDRFAGSAQGGPSSC